MRYAICCVELTPTGNSYRENEPLRVWLARTLLVSSIPQHVGIPVGLDLSLALYLIQTFTSPEKCSDERHKITLK